MNYWWVNQGQTHRHEIGEGYMWSPKRQTNGQRHFSYEYMKHIQPGDVIFSYANTAIVAIGLAKTHCYPYPKPVEFGRAGIYWQDEGWKVDVAYKPLARPLRTMDHIDGLRSLLPRQKSPLRFDNGGANQAYLFKIDELLALTLANFVDRETVDLVSGRFVAEISLSKETCDAQIEEWENRIEAAITSAEDLMKTEKETLIKARRGQGKFRQLLLAREPRCRVTGVDRAEHLIASHIKPWRSATNGERLDPENGFMLTPSIDHLFDRGFISFENNGAIILADVADRGAMEKMGIIRGASATTIGTLSMGQKNFLAWHREYLLLS